VATRGREFPNSKRAGRNASEPTRSLVNELEKPTQIDTFLSELARDLKDKTYHPSPVRRVMIPKADGSLRPLGIPTIRDRVPVCSMLWFIVRHS